MKVTLNIYIPKIYEYENHFNKSITGAYERREAAQRRVKLQYVLQTIRCRITPLQTALFGKPL